MAIKLDDATTTPKRGHRASKTQLGFRARVTLPKTHRVGLARLTLLFSKNKNRATLRVLQNFIKDNPPRQLPCRNGQMKFP